MPLSRASTRRRYNSILGITQGTYCIVAIEDKKMGFTSYCLSLSLYIMSSCLSRYSCSYELNTLDACWIAVDVCSNSRRCRIVSVYLSQTWCLYTMIMPRYSHNYALFYPLLDSNLFTHRRILLSWEKPLVKPMAPGSILNILIYNLLYFALFTFCSYIQKYQKYETIISIISHFHKWP